MAKETITATIDSETLNKIKSIAKKEKRSVSNTIDLLLQNAISELEKKGA